MPYKGKALTTKSWQRVSENLLSSSGLLFFYYFLFLLYFGCHSCQREKNPVSKGFSVTLPDNQPNNWLGNRLTTSPIFYFNHSFGNSICFISASVSS